MFKVGDNYYPVASIADSAFAGVTAITTLIIPSTIMNIGDNAFDSCTGLISVIIEDADSAVNARIIAAIPTGVRSIGNDAFAGCNSLTTIIVYARTPPSLGRNGLPDGDTLTSIYVPAASVNMYKAAPGWNRYADIIKAIGSGDGGGGTEPPAYDIALDGVGTTWDAAVTAIKNGGNNKTYVIDVNRDFNRIGDTAATFGTVTGLDVTINSSNNSTISLTGTGSLLYIGASQVVTMDGLTLKGNEANNTALVWIDTDAAFTLNGGEVFDNTFLYGRGAGVFVGDNSTFIMNGGKVSGNKAYEGSGVLVSDNGSFTITGGEVSGNTSTFGDGNWPGGGAVFIDNGTFTMTGGKVSGNTANGSGAGIRVGDNGTFTMSGGEVSGNTANSYAGGVYVDGTFIMTGGEVSGNTSGATGGAGVSVMSGNTFIGTFIMSGNAKVSGNETVGGGGGGVLTGGIFIMSGSAKVSGNTASGGGGGVWVVIGNGNFTMNGGEVSGNKSNGYGGGVALTEGSTFTMSGNAKVSDNTSISGGGGVFVDNGTFNMTGGTLSGNKSNGDGGGVYVGHFGGSWISTFRVSNGTVYGENEGALSNIATNGAALNIGVGCTAEHGTFTGIDDAWVSKGTLTTTDNTIEVINGVLQ